MSGLVTLSKFRALSPSTLTDAKARQYLRVTQAIVEAVTSLRFGSEVSSVTNPSGDVRRITFYGGTFDVGDEVRLIGGGSPTTVFEITDVGLGTAAGEMWVEIESDTEVSPTRMLPVITYEGQAQSGHVYCYPRPVFSIVSVKTRSSAETLWKDTGVVTVDVDAYEPFKVAGLNAGVLVKRSVLPMVLEDGSFLVKRRIRQMPAGYQVKYAAGFYLQIPADIEDAAMQIMAAVERSSEDGGVFAQESLDYYSYTQLSYEQLNVLPGAAVSILSRYARL